ncbi:MAG: hypothetical protein OXE94_07055 [Aestuariivita sp.]|nr:hypothetical protein [Aestuariivita sp.]MCY4202423.1 hypothetical protein [Aestuariivita sp.]MCY4288637.1 hypothetical protein [Aestuariivita sp.]MCY4345591.1 hypothetical protein [Aestuariivita sp.]
MTTSQNSLLSEVFNGDEIPLETLSYFRERFRDHLYDLVIEEFEKKYQNGDLTRADIAKQIGRRPEQITRWLGAPGNWTLETVSDLLLAITKSEPVVSLLPLEGRSPRNYQGQDDLTSPQGHAVEARSVPETAIRAHENGIVLRMGNQIVPFTQRRNCGLREATQRPWG